MQAIPYSFSFKWQFRRLGKVIATGKIQILKISSPPPPYHEMILAIVFSVLLPWRANFGKAHHRVPIGHVETPQFCGVAGCFDDDIELCSEIRFLASQNGFH